MVEILQELRLHAVEWKILHFAVVFEILLLFSVKLSWKLSYWVNSQVKKCCRFAPVCLLVFEQINYHKSTASMRDKRVLDKDIEKPSVETFVKLLWLNVEKTIWQTVREVWYVCQAPEVSVNVEGISASVSKSSLFGRQRRWPWNQSRSFTTDWDVPHLVTVLRKPT